MPLTAEQYDAKFTAQGGRCILCDKKAHLVVDYDPLTGVIRELVCTKCYRMLVAFKHDPVIMQRAIDYWERHNK